MHKQIASLINAQVKTYGKKALKVYRERQLRPGENGWGAVAPRESALHKVGKDSRIKVAVIGLGAQGIAHGRAFQQIKGIEIVGVADLKQERLRAAAGRLSLPETVLFTDADAMLTKLASELDLVSIATTAPFHVSLGRLVLKHGVKKIVLEKPVDVSLKDARAFARECRQAGVDLAVNYSRRWLPDYRAIKRAVEKGFIGKLRSIDIAVGKGELAMIGSHYFDVCRFLLDAEPASVSAELEPNAEANRRGGDYDDPHGFCLFRFENGERVFVDFSSDMKSKNSQLLLKGDNGYIFIDEANSVWNVQVSNQMQWQVPFAEPMSSYLMFKNTVVDVLNRERAERTDEDGLAALEMIVGAHLSSRADGRRIKFPLSDADAEINVIFP